MPPAQEKTSKFPRPFLPLSLPKFSPTGCCCDPRTVSQLTAVGIPFLWVTLCRAALFGSLFTIIISEDNREGGRERGGGRCYLLLLFLAIPPSSSSCFYCFSPVAAARLFDLFWSPSPSFLSSSLLRSLDDRR